MLANDGNPNQSNWLATLNQQYISIHIPHSHTVRYSTISFYSKTGYHRGPRNVHVKNTTMYKKNLPITTAGKYSAFPISYVVHHYTGMLVAVSTGLWQR